MADDRTARGMTRRWARVSVQLLAIGAVAALDGACVKCRGNQCPRTFNLGAYCAQTGACSIDGTPETSVSSLPPGAVLSIPIPWQDLTSQDGLEFDAVDTVDGSGLQLATAIVLFDHGPAACTFDETKLALSCPNVPRAVSTISFSYGTRGGVGFTLWAEMNDDACDAKYPPCEE
jgi:hypothetical protein